MHLWGLRVLASDPVAGIRRIVRQYGTIRDGLTDFGPPVLLFVIYAAILLWPITLHPTDALMPKEGIISDLTQQDWPYASLLRSTWSRYGELPLWNPLAMSGEPFMANPIAHLWYFPSLLIRILLPPPLSFNVLYWLHIAWAGLGMYLFLLNENMGRSGALIGALVFEGLPKGIAHLSVGHAALVFAISWTPWLLASARMVRKHPSVKNGFGVGTILAIILLIDPRWAIFAGYLLFGFCAYLWIQDGVGGTAGHKDLLGLIRKPQRALMGALFAVLTLSAIQVLPTLEYFRVSTRSELDFAQSTAFSLPWEGLLGIIQPAVGDSHEWVTYLGQGSLVLALLALLLRCRQAHFWVVVLGVAAIYSLGPKGMLYQLAYLVPGVKALRVPARSWFIVGFAASVLAAYGVDSLLRMERGDRRAVAFVAALTAFMAVMVALAFHLADNLAAAVMISALVSLAGILVIGRILGLVRNAILMALISLIVMLDMTWAGSHFVGHRSVAQIFGQTAAARWLAEQQRPFRIYSPSLSIASPFAADLYLEQASGVNSLQMADYSLFMRHASGVAYDGYSVTIPAFLSPNLATANASARPDSALLGLLNVEYIVADFTLDVPGLKPTVRFGEKVVYRNEFSRGRAWLAYNVVTVPDHTTALDSILSSPEKTVAEGGIRLVGEGAQGRIDISLMTPNYLSLVASPTRQALLILSEIYYPGWVARVDGQSTPIVRVNGFLRGVYLQPGIHEVEFLFRPFSLYVGMGALILYCMGWLVGQKMKWWNE